MTWETEGRWELAEVWGSCLVAVSTRAMWAKDLSNRAGGDWGGLGKVLTQKLTGS